MPRPPSPRRRALCALVPCALLLVPSCGPPASAPVGTERVELTGLELSAAAREPRVVLRLEPARDPEGWRARADEVATVERAPVPGAEGAGADAALPLLVLRGDGPKSLSVVGPFEPGAFDRLVVELFTPAPNALEVQPRTAGERAGPSAFAPVTGALDGDLVVFDLVSWRNLDAPFDELVLGLRDSKPSVGVAQLTLLATPPRARLPLPGEPAELVTVSGQARRAVGLSSAAPLRARFDALPGAVLSFGFGVPDDLVVRALGRPVVRARLRRDGGAWAREVEHPLEVLGEAPIWHSAEIPLEELGGGPVELELTLVADTPVEALCAVEEPRQRVPGAPAPTVLLITSDTHRADHLGVAGGEVDVDTPTIDALAARGVYFEDCLSTTNVTLPSHVTLMTAVHPRDHGLTNNAQRLADEAPTLAEAFAAAGFTCVASVSVEFLGEPETGVGQGFARVAYPNGRLTTAADRTLEKLERWLPELEGLPLFVWLHLFDAHMPYKPPDDRFLERYWKKDVDPFDPTIPLPEDLPEGALEGIFRELRDLDFGRASYRAEVSYLDQELTRLLDRPRFRDGVVAFTADHGETLAGRRVYFSHAGLFPDNLSVPLVLAWPQAPRGARVATPVTNLDVGRTLLDLAGLQAAPFPGRSLLERLEDAPDVQEPRFALESSNQGASVTWRQYHLVLHFGVPPLVRERDGLTDHQVELFDHVADPRCERDLVAAGEELETARTLRTRLVEWLSSGAPRAWAGATSQDPDVIADLAALGYTIDDAAVESELFDADCGCAQCARWR